jgi:hypothetical protein
MFISSFPFFHLKSIQFPDFFRYGEYALRYAGELNVLVVTKYACFAPCTNTAPNNISTATTPTFFVLLYLLHARRIKLEFFLPFSLFLTYSLNAY